ncbi:MAG: DF family (seleno)protein [Solirubrobacteraceae bacterium]
MRIELLYFDGCPSHEAFLPRLRELLAQAGVDAPIAERRVRSNADAQRERFLGSPTLRVDGLDVDPDAGERTDYGLKCRLYRTADGLSGAPRDEWVLGALHHARTAG